MSVHLGFWGIFLLEEIYSSRKIHLYAATCSWAKNKLVDQIFYLQPISFLLGSIEPKMSYTRDDCAHHVPSMCPVCEMVEIC